MPPWRRRRSLRRLLCRRSGRHRRSIDTTYSSSSSTGWRRPNLWRALKRGGRGRHGSGKPKHRCGAAGALRGRACSRCHSQCRGGRSRHEPTARPTRRHRRWRMRMPPTACPTRCRPTFGGACGRWTVTDRPRASSTSRPSAPATDRTRTPLRTSRAWVAAGHCVSSGPVRLPCSSILSRRRPHLHFTDLEPLLPLMKTVDEGRGRRCGIQRKWTTGATVGYV